MNDNPAQERTTRTPITLGLVTERRLLIESGGKQRILLSAKLTDKGDVYVWVTPGEKYRQRGVPSEGTGNEHHGVVERESRWSIHPSLDSTSGVNMLKHQTWLENDTVHDSVHLTRALKTPSRIAPLFSRRYSNLAADGYVVTDFRSSDVFLEGYDPENYTLYCWYYVTAGTDDTPTRAQGSDFNVAEVPIGPHRLGIIWSFHMTPAGGASLDQMSVTARDGGKHSEELMSGYEWPRALVDFKASRKFSRLEQLKLAEKEKRPAHLIKFMRENERYFRQGVARTMEHSEFMGDLLAKGRTVVMVHKPARVARKKKGRNFQR